MTDFNSNTEIIEELRALILSIDPLASLPEITDYNDNTQVIEWLRILTLVIGEQKTIFTGGEMSQNSIVEGNDKNISIGTTDSVINVFDLVAGLKGGTDKQATFKMFQNFFEIGLNSYSASRSFSLHGDRISISNGGFGKVGSLEIGNNIAVLKGGDNLLYVDDITGITINGTDEGSKILSKSQIYGLHHGEASSLFCNALEPIDGAFGYIVSLWDNSKINFTENSVLGMSPPALGQVLTVYIKPNGYSFSFYSDTNIIIDPNTETPDLSVGNMILVTAVSSFDNTKSIVMYKNLPLI